MSSSIDRYLEELAPDQRAAFERVRAVVRAVAPDAEEGRSYGMPAILHAGRPLLGIQAAKQHLSIFPFSPAVVESVADRLDGFSLSKGTIRFSVGNPVPEDVLAAIVRARLDEIAAA